MLDLSVFHKTDSFNISFVILTKTIWIKVQFTKYITISQENVI